MTEIRKLTLPEGRKAVSAARSAIDAAFGKKLPKETEKLPLIFYENRGVFVTLTLGGELRGCIGFPYPVMTLENAIAEAACAAAFDDPRFLPISRSDAEKISLEVTILTEPELLTGGFTEYEKNIVIGKHGLIVEYDENRGLLLPQVASENGFDAVEFLCQTAMKAGMPPMSWKYGAKVYTFEGQIFSETAPKGDVVEKTL